MNKIDKRTQKRCLLFMLFLSKLLHRDNAFDVWVWVIIFESKVFVFEIKDAFHLGIDNHAWEFAWFARELFLNLLKVIVIDVSIAKSVNEVTHFKTSNLCYHHKQKCV